MARSTLVWLFPYEGAELIGRARQGVFTRQCPACGYEFSVNGSPVGHKLWAVKTTEMR